MAWEEAMLLEERIKKCNKVPEMPGTQLRQEQSLASMETGTRAVSQNVRAPAGLTATMGPKARWGAGSVPPEWWGCG